MNSVQKQKILELKNINFGYENTKVLSDVSFEVEKGDFVGLIGPNGSGKTTLLKIILGILPLQEGSIKINGKLLNKFNDWSKIGYVPQKATNIEKNFPATVYEVVSMGLLSIKKFPKIITKKDDEKIRKALAVVKMSEYSKRRITDLSGGQQQRVLIAKALVTRPEVLMLDEPTTGIDQENQKSFYQLLGKLNKEGMTIMLVSHDIGRITDYVTKIASINQTLNFYGSHKEFCSKDPNHKHQHSLCLDRG
jgi:zinc transport system ATP-binding protein